MDKDKEPNKGLINILKIWLLTSNDEATATLRRSTLDYIEQLEEKVKKQ